MGNGCVVAETERGDTILAEIEQHRPDVAVVDIDLPGMDGIVAAQRLKDAGSPVRILVLTSVGTISTAPAVTVLHTQRAPASPQLRETASQ